MPYQALQGCARLCRALLGSTGLHTPLPSCLKLYQGPTVLYQAVPGPPHPFGLYQALLGPLEAHGGTALYQVSPSSLPGSTGLYHPSGLYRPLPSLTRLYWALPTSTGLYPYRSTKLYRPIQGSTWSTVRTLLSSIELCRPIQGSTELKRA